MSHPRYPNALPAAAVVERLAAATATAHHAFWPDAISMLGTGRIEWSAVLGARQVTDVSLLALAAGQGGRLVTLDRVVPLKAVPVSKARHLVVI